MWKYLLWSYFLALRDNNSIMEFLFLFVKSWWFSIFTVNSEIGSPNTETIGGCWTLGYWNTLNDTDCDICDSR